MAQRFAIDGNCTQSFVGTVRLNAEACPADTDNFATLFYDLEKLTLIHALQNLKLLRFLNF